LYYLAGCSSDYAKLATYETLQNHRHWQCLEQLDDRRCDEQRQSYQAYQKARERHLQAE
jgi:hypothetical protein